MPLNAARRADWAGRCRRRLLGISAGELKFGRRGFRGGRPEMRQRIEAIGASFAWGYHAALESSDLDHLVQTLDATSREAKGFAFEGAAMGLAILDWLTPWDRRRAQTFLAGVGDAHAYMVHVGVGWALARLPTRVGAFLDRFDQLLRWLILDGWGFHEGFFHARQAIEGCRSPARLEGYGRRAFDQGLGRSLWFVNGGEVQFVRESIGRYEGGRHNDLWSGVGLACAYAGGISEPEELAELRRAAGAHLAALAQGAAFAAKARLRADNPAPHTESVCRSFCDLSAEEAAAVTDRALIELPKGEGGQRNSEPAYEVWRQRVQAAFVPS